MMGVGSFIVYTFKTAWWVPLTLKTQMPFFVFSFLFFFFNFLFYSFCQLSPPLSTMQSYWVQFVRVECYNRPEEDGDFLNFKTTFWVLSFSKAKEQWIHKLFCSL